MNETSAAPPPTSATSTTIPATSLPSIPAEEDFLPPMEISESDASPMLLSEMRRGFSSAVGAAGAAAVPFSSANCCTSSSASRCRKPA